MTLIDAEKAAELDAMVARAAARLAERALREDDATREQPRPIPHRNTVVRER